MASTPTPMTRHARARSSTSASTTSPASTSWPATRSARWTTSASCSPSTATRPTARTATRSTTSLLTCSAYAPRWPRWAAATASAAQPTFADLQRELSPISPRAWRFAVLRGASRAGALLSDGLRIGYRHGFDSGPFMNHVYANRPSGRTALGRAIDRRLLRRRTCVAFRDIRALAEHAVFDALREERSAAPVVADLAAGPAPYLLTAL